ncbi:MAG: hypothetical protein EZS28_052505, partial [Streblomastix strix]
PIKAQLVAEDIARQLTALVRSVRSIIHEDCTISKQHMESCNLSVNELVKELDVDMTDMENFIVRLEKLLTDLSNAESLSSKLKEIKENLTILELLAQQIL